MQGPEFHDLPFWKPPTRGVTVAQPSALSAEYVALVIRNSIWEMVVRHLVYNGELLIK